MNISKKKTIRQKPVTELLKVYNDLLGSKIQPRSLVVINKIKENISKAISLGMPLPIFDNLYNLIDEDLLKLSYGIIKSNKGATTLSTDTSKSTDNVSNSIFLNIAYKLKHNQYKFSEIKRVLVPKPGKTEKRLLGIPTFHDKIIQQAVLIILEAIYEPIFAKQNFNYGFRPGKNCHQTIIKIVQKGQGMSYVIEGDIKSAYDNVNHSKLIYILSQRILDKKFLDLIDKLCKAGIFDELANLHKHTIIGVPQGGIVSPILFNIYMFEMDKFINIHIGDLFKTLNKRQGRSIVAIKSKRYQRILYSLNRALKSRSKLTCEHTLLDLNLQQQQQYKELSLKIKQLTNLLMKTSSINKAKSPLRFFYVRYADDWVFLTNGKESLAKLIKNKIQSFLWYDLGLTLSHEKTIITPMELGFNFLGFNIHSPSNRSRIRNDDLLNYNIKRTSKNVVVKPDHKRILFKLIWRGFCDSKGFPRELPALSIKDSFEIISYYNSVLRGIAGFYHIIDYPSSMCRYFYIITYSLVKTLAQKYSTSTTKIIERFGNPIKYTGISFDKQVFINQISYDNFCALLNRRIDFIGANRTTTDLTNDFFELTRIYWRTSFKLNSFCIICGSKENIHMHHIRQVCKGRAIGFSKIMSNLNRKQVPLCSYHHQLIHSGKFDSDISLSDLYDTRIALSETLITSKK